MDIFKFLRRNSKSDSLFHRPPKSINYERVINSKDEMIKLLKSENNALRKERKRLLDHWLTPIPDYEQQQIFGNEVGQAEYNEEDLYDLKAGTQIDGEA